MIAQLYIGGGPETTVLGLPLSLFTLLFGAAASLAGVWVGAFLSRNAQEKQRKLDWLATQLREFYGPLWAIRLEIRALSEFGFLVQAKSMREEQALIDSLRNLPPDEQTEKIERISEQYSGDIAYNNARLHEHILPAYRRMQQHFRDYMHLAEPETVAHFNTLVRYNETWTLSNYKGIAFRVALAVRVKEAELFPLYEHLESTVSELQSCLKLGRLPKVKMTTSVVRAWFWKHGNLISMFTALAIFSPGSAI